MNSAFSSVIGFPCLPILPWHSMLLSRRCHQSRWILPAQLDEDLVEPKSRLYPVLVVVDDCNAREKNSLRVAPSLIYRLDSREFDADLSFRLDKDRKVGLKSYSSLKGCPIWHLSYWSADLLPGHRSSIVDRAAQFASCHRCFFQVGDDVKLCQTPILKMTVSVIDDAL